jgi:mercuric ion binding protein
MKRNNLKIKLMGVFMVASLFTFANVNPSKTRAKGTTITDTFQVSGNCGMCEKTIETAVKGMDGIVKADWNKETKMMHVTYNDKKVTLTQIKTKIASVGYDTDEIKASDSSYDKLPGCCQYGRKSDAKESIDEHKGHNH